MIVNNYDLEAKIKKANQNIDIKNLVISNVPYLVAFNAMIGILRVPGYNQVPRILINNIIMLTTMSILDVRRDNKKNLHDKAYIDLINLSTKLKERNINTSPELLKQAKLMKRPTYNVRLSEKNIPILIQNKYMLVQTYNHKCDINKEPLSLHQEHVLGSKKYTLKLGTPDKKTNYAFSYGT